MSMNRRQFLQSSTTLAAGLAFNTQNFEQNIIQKSFFEISLAEWSFHRTLSASKMTNLDFPAIAKKQFGISVVEYVKPVF